jgi:hypothetical protein
VKRCIMVGGELSCVKSSVDHRGYGVNKGAGKRRARVEYHVGKIECRTNSKCSMLRYSQKVCGAA